jgi:anion transporter
VTVSGSRLVTAGRVAVIAVPVALWFLPLPVPPAAQRAFAVSAFIILAWMTHALDPAIAGLIGCFLYWSLRIVSFEHAFAGFATTTPWFLVAAILLGTVATKTGVARRLALVVMRAIGTSYSRLLLGLLVTMFLLTYVIPSGLARVVILGGVAVGLVDAFGLARGSNVGRGMFVLLTYVGSITGKMLIGDPSPIMARDALERVAAVTVRYTEWLAAYWPCQIVTVVAAWRLALWLFPPEKAELPGGTAYIERELRELGPMSPAERRAAAFLLIAVGLWITDFTHDIPVPMVGIGVALAATLPAIGVLDTDDVRRVNYLPVFFVASAVSLGHVLTETHAIDVITRGLFDGMLPLLSDAARSTVTLLAAGFAYHVVIGDEISMLGTSLPPLIRFTAEHALPTVPIVMVWTFSAGAKVFLYQSAVLIVGHAYGYFTSRDLFVVGLLLTLVTSCVQWVLVVFYWPLIGLG